MINDIKKKIKRIHYLQNKSFVPEYAKGNKIVYLTKSKEKQISDLLLKIKITINSERIFQHWIDEDIYFINEKSVLGNMPPNYNLILDNSIRSLMEKYPEKKVLLSAIENYIQRIISNLEKQNHEGKLDYTIQLYSNILDFKAESLDDALQRILLWSSLFWQTGHKLVGLGRLDMLLDSFYDNDNEEYYQSRFVEFFRCLHDYYEFKSSQLKGDIGQIAIVGGVDKDGKCFYNRFTVIIIRAIKELNEPDPKVLLRVCNNTPDEIWNEALLCIKTGVGSPLLSNDEIVIPSLCEFGYELEDARNYVTSACWEPLSYGNSLEQNNLININFAEMFAETLKDDSIKNIKEYSEFVKKYYEHLDIHVRKLLQAISRLRWEEDPLYSLLTETCMKKAKDISDGGAKYNNYGVLSVGIANTVDSLLNIKKYVFEEKRYELNAIVDVWNSENSEEKTNIQKDLLTLKKSFGHDDIDSIKTTQEIMDHVSNQISTYVNYLGGRVKFGLSSPAYVVRGNDTDMTFDGRQKGDSLNVHISVNDNTAYTELIGFASDLVYSGNQSNGNVIDFMITPSFIEHNFEKMLTFLKLSVRRGFFQMQINVINSEQLIEAKANPDKYPNLIVRVWGFSSYFKDLPEEYKDVLIKRALLSEGKQ